MDSQIHMQMKVLMESTLINLLIGPTGRVLQSGYPMPVMVLLRSTLYILKRMYTNVNAVHCVYQTGCS